MIKIIIVAVVIWALVKIFAPPKKKGGNSGSGTQPNQNQSAMKQAAKQTVDQSIVDRIMLMTSTAIHMAEMADDEQHGRPHGAFIRVSAGDFDGRSWVEVNTTIFNIWCGWGELDALAADKTHENARRFLGAAGLHSVNSNDFLQCVQVAKIEHSRSIYPGSFTLYYAPAIPYGTGHMYYAELSKKLKDRWPYLQFEYGQCDIDLDIA